jgi:hypothetical protein
MQFWSHTAALWCCRPGLARRDCIRCGPDLTGDGLDNILDALAYLDAFAVGCS